MNIGSILRMISAGVSFFLQQLRAREKRSPIGYLDLIAACFISILSGSRIEVSGSDDRPGFALLTTGRDAAAAGLATGAGA